MGRKVRQFGKYFPKLHQSYIQALSVSLGMTEFGLIFKGFTNFFVLCKFEQQYNPINHVCISSYPQASFRSL